MKIKESYKNKRDSKKLDIAHEIQQLFRYQYKNQEVDQSFINSHNRLWINVFNDLVKKGFIGKRKTQTGYSYKWIAHFPEI
jgi:hypothetical protein